ncbi:NADP-dependent malic enzyme [Methylobacterium sp. J-090]|uniref:NADP-dependent malic enzyme n=1 Tax=Methylobacterium sp. J-090 TaxID=2836666 RepID=UPI001FB89DF7|nr:NADP-dependent malic enzyme [Methylobacterium sp. J-090]MCJ2081471.1 NADP-dependent malic enzyme [Methylobacterium sp. J-090]
MSNEADLRAPGAVANADAGTEAALERAALDYHRFPTPGKISVQPTKDMSTQRDLALAYSPGVAAACMAIKHDPEEAYNLTSRGNLVAVITNGTAVLGLGNIGALAGKPVMEGKGCLFKKFAGIDVFDIEIDETDPEKLIEIIARLEPTFGGINLEDIKAPECFTIETRLRERMKIPVFHDDQHGTAIVAAAALLNALQVVGKPIEQVRLVCSGAGAAAIACLNILVGLGLARENILVCDSRGVVSTDRLASLDAQKAAYARDTQARTLADAIVGADIFLGVSQGGVLKPEMVAGMADKPIILALANPDPEILPDLARSVRPDCLMATGRSDYPNQVNNVLCFPFIFRGALDVGATEINEAMKLAAVRAIAELVHAESSDVVSAAYGAQDLSFGPDYLIPRPFDPRLITSVAPAVARAAMESGVAARPIADLDAYRRSLQRFVYTSGTVMQPVFAAASRAGLKRVAFAEGEDDRVLRAAQVVADERLALPVLVGRPDVIAARIKALSLRLTIGQDVEVAEASGDATRAAATMLREGRIDGLLCGTTGTYAAHLAQVSEVIGRAPGAEQLAAMGLLQLPRHTVFICDPYIHADPSAEEIAGMTVLAAAEMRRFGQTPRVALVSHSSFGSADDAEARKMRDALGLIRARAPDLEIDGEMSADAALNRTILTRIKPDSALTAEANLLIMPNLGAANITFNALKVVSGQGVSIGPILLGAAKPVHILTPTATVRGIVNMTALTAVAASTEG